MIEFSVIILSYNPDFGQIKSTIDSVIRQRDIEYEIIVCDDASKENYFDKIETYFIEHKVTNYRLLPGEINQGTVCNILKGLEIATGTYAKLIGAGDLLYEESTLKDVRDFMEKNQADCCFGMLRGYRIKDGKRSFFPHVSPRDIEVYRNWNEKKIIRNLLLCEDWVSGAGVFARTDYYKKYTSMLKGKVLYCEDWASALAVVDNVFLKLYDRYVVWYEVGEGISTSSNKSFREKLKKDNRQFWEIFDAYCEAKEQKQFARYIRKRKRKKKLEHLESELIKNIYKSIVNPEMLLYELNARMQQKKKKFLPLEQRKGFLN